MASTARRRSRRLVRISLGHLRNFRWGLKLVEHTKVPIARWPTHVVLFLSVHLLAVLGAIIIITLNLCGAWIGKELQGQISEDGQKLFALQLTAKVHELFMTASLSHIICSMILKRLTRGTALPFASIGAGLRFQDPAFLFSREYLALGTASFSGKARLLLLITVGTLLAAVVGPSSATAMTPILDNWSAGSTPFALNATQEQLWPSFINTSSEVHTKDAAWISLEQNLFSYWGRETLGSVLAGPETVSIPSASSVRTMNVRFRGPFSLYQPELTAVSVQMAVIANAANSIRLPWYQDNVARCAWAKTRITGGLCMYRDIQWTIRALQPVVKTGCLRVDDPQSPQFPTLTLGAANIVASSHEINYTSDDPRPSSALRGINLEGPDFATTSGGVLVTTSAFTGSNTSEQYACAIDTQWAYADAKTTFLGGPYVVSGSPELFFAPNETSSTYEGWRVKIDPGWVDQVNPSVGSSSDTESAFDKLIHAGATSEFPESQSKVEAVVAVLIAEAMASLGSLAAIQGGLPGSTDTIKSIEVSAGGVKQKNGYHELTLQTTVTGYAYGISSANGVSASSLLSVLILIFYVLLATICLVPELLSRYHVNSWNNFTDMMALALHSSTGSHLQNTSAGVASMDSLRVPVFFAEREGSVEMVFGVGNNVGKTAYPPLELGKAYS